PNLFAVGCHEYEPTDSNEVVEGGKNILWFEKGLFQHSRAKEFSSGETAWASGGSAMFDRDKWMQLGGFSEKYYPAYWEDLDLSMRAKQKGWAVWFCERARVTHQHESTNQTTFGADKLTQLSWKHADHFTKKFAQGKQKFDFYLFRPYWWWQRLKCLPNSFFWIFLIVILLVATITRFYRLARVPAGMTWDEAAIGYNGYAVVRTRYDEWLNHIPISFRSFGDYKAPLAIYLVGIVTNLFGLNLLAIRSMFALSGVVGVGLFIWLTRELLTIHAWRSPKKMKLRLPTLALAAGLLLAISPWHLQFTRVGFESGLALTLLLAGVLSVMKIFSNKPKSKKVFAAGWTVLGASMLVASMYTYHSNKLVVPLLVLSFGLIHFRQIKKVSTKVIGGSILGLLFLAPMIYDSIWGEGLSRSRSFLFSHLSSLKELPVQLLIRFFAHLSPAFLVGGWSDTLRHGPQAHSLFLFVVMILILVGLISLIWQSIKQQKLVVWLKLSLLWIGLGLLPAILGIEYPQANRALLALPGFLWLAIAGIEKIIDFAHQLKPSLSSTRLLIVIFLIIAGNFILYLDHYYRRYAVQSAAAFNEGYIETMSLVYEYERGVNNKPEVDQIIFSNQYGQPYIYALFVRKTLPIWYQGGSLIKYKFLDKVDPGHLALDNALVVATKYDEMLDHVPTHIIESVDKSISFRIYYTGHHS
ncbi:MAG TPA: hypothetical protein PLM16_03090, partial [Candidatus Woesebacteria bacterium]|nr:hypothetical protein [Candidatus Woesebacteria bacterium]